MPMPLKLGITFTQAEVDAMKAGVLVVVTTIHSKIIANLSVEEREKLSKLGPNREPYVHKSIADYGLVYPHLNPIAYAYADAEKDAAVYGQMEEVLTPLTEATEVARELQMLAGHFAFLFMRKQFANAELNKDENVPGAQVVYDGLKDCFAGQGPQDPPVEP